MVAGDYCTDSNSDAFCVVEVSASDTLPSAETFFTEYVKHNRPLVLRGAAAAWPATHWSAESLSAAFGEEVVTVAPLHTSGPHSHLDKWLERSDAWEHTEPEPEVCDADQLLVVSAMRVKMRVKKFVRLIGAETPSAGFYADGAGNLTHSFPFLRDAFAPPPFAAWLQLKRADLWMGGRSISRMHYDNLDNLFAQVVGRKTFVLSPPHAGAAVQGGKRLRKAACRYTHPGSFARDGGGVLHETVLNYLGCERPPSLPTVSVTLGPGDMLYLPFGWWHEVHSHPDTSRGNLCASVSHFYAPYYCRLGGKSCTRLGPLMVNPCYAALDESDADAADKGDAHDRSVAQAAQRGRLATVCRWALPAFVAAIAVLSARRTWRRLT